MEITPIFECHELTKKFGSKIALNEISLEVGKGKIVGLLGPNGSGKTTLIKILNGLIQPSKGLVFIDAEKPNQYTRSIVSYLPDKNYFADWMKVRDILDMFEDFYEDFDRERAESMCASLGVSENDRIKAMSKGTKEKVQLTMVMCRRAQLYLLDEPIAGVDPAARDYILKMITDNFSGESTILISTHLVADIENILDEVIFIKDGRIIRQSSVADIRENEGMSVDELFRSEFRWGGERHDI